jgi:hypothetical protein
VVDHTGEIRAPAVNVTDPLTPESTTVPPFLVVTVDV